jgi:hypothetical protein
MLVLRTCQACGGGLCTTHELFRQARGTGITDEPESRRKQQKPYQWILQITWDPGQTLRICPG